MYILLYIIYIHTKSSTNGPCFHLQTMISPTQKAKNCSRVLLGNLVIGLVLALGLGLPAMGSFQWERMGMNGSCSNM